MVAATNTARIDSYGADTPPYSTAHAVCDQRTPQSDPRVSRSPFFRAAQSTGASAGDCGSMRRTARVDGEVRENHEGQPIERERARSAFTPAAFFGRHSAAQRWRTMRRYRARRVRDGERRRHDGHVGRSRRRVAVDRVPRLDAKDDVGFHARRAAQSCTMWRFISGHVVRIARGRTPKTQSTTRNSALRGCTFDGCSEGDVGLPIAAPHGNVIAERSDSAAGRRCSVLVLKDHAAPTAPRRARGVASTRAAVNRRSPT